MVAVIILLCDCLETEMFEWADWAENWEEQGRLCQKIENSNGLLATCKEVLRVFLLLLLLLFWLCLFRFFFYLMMLERVTCSAGRLR